MKLVLRPGEAHFVNIYKPFASVGAAKPRYGFSIDREFLEEDERFNEMFVKTPGSREKKSIPVTCDRPPEVKSDDVDALIDAFLVCQATNVSADKILMTYPVEIDVEFFEMNVIGRLGIGLSLKGVKVFLK